MDEQDNKRLKRTGRLVSLGVALIVFVALNVAVPRESRSEITFLFFSALAYGMALFLFYAFRTALARGWFSRLRGRIYYMRRTTFFMIWAAAILLSMLSLIGGIVSRRGGVRFLLVYLIPIVLIGSASLMSVEDRDDSG